jgi:hypothetical protein
VLPSTHIPSEENKGTNDIMQQTENHSFLPNMAPSLKPTGLLNKGNRKLRPSYIPLYDANIKAASLASRCPRKGRGTTSCMLYPIWNATKPTSKTLSITHRMCLIPRWLVPRDPIAWDWSQLAGSGAGSEAVGAGFC